MQLRYEDLAGAGENGRRRVTNASSGALVDAGHTARAHGLAREATTKDSPPCA